MSISSPISVFGIDRRSPLRRAPVDYPLTAGPLTDGNAALAQPLVGPRDPWAVTSEQPLVVDSFTSVELRSDRLAQLHAYWQGKRVGDALPSRAAIDVLDLRFCIGHLILIDAAPLDRGPAYRVYGTAVAKALGSDMTGEPVGEGPGTAPYLATLADGVPRYCITTLPMREGNQLWERLILPLSPNGTAATQLLVCALPFSAPAA